MSDKMGKKDLKIVFFGTPEFAVASLDRIVGNGWQIAAVVTMPDKTAGRGHKRIESDVKKYAVAKGLKVLQPAKLKAPDFIEALKEINADLFVVIAFRMLPREVWEMPRLGTFNLHGSLLPKYRGAAPINRAVMNGETVTGVTTFFLRHEIDTGDIIDMRQTTIGPDDNAGDVHDRLMAIGAEMVESTLEKIVDGTVTTHPQPEGVFTPAPKIFKETCLIDWTAGEADIHNHVRGLAPYPGAWTVMTDQTGKETEVKILRTIRTGKSTDAAPGTCLSDGHHLEVATGDGLIEVAELQPAGKKRMAADAFLRGYHAVRFGNPASEDE